MNEIADHSTPHADDGGNYITPSPLPPDASVPLTQWQKGHATRRARKEKWAELRRREAAEAKARQRSGKVVVLDDFRLPPCRRPRQAPDPALRIAASPSTGADGHGAKKPDEADYARVFNELADAWRDHKERQKLLAGINAALDKMTLHELRALALFLGAPPARQLHASNALPTPAPHDPQPPRPAA
jgi:hypothetical protein